MSGLGLTRTSDDVVAKSIGEIIERAVQPPTTRGGLRRPVIAALIEEIELSRTPRLIEEATDTDSK